MNSYLVLLFSNVDRFAFRKISMRCCLNHGLMFLFVVQGEKYRARERERLQNNGKRIGIYIDVYEEKIQMSFYSKEFKWVWDWFSRQNQELMFE